LIDLLVEVCLKTWVEIRRSIELCSRNGFINRVAKRLINWQKRKIRFGSQQRIQRRIKTGPELYTEQDASS
jgi:hypothetical protein